MKLIAKWVSILQNPLWSKVLLGLGILWLLLLLICWFSGILAFLPEGKRRRIHSRLPGCLPIGQIYYTIRLGGLKKGSLWAVFLIWWWLAFSFLGGALLIWSIVFSTRGLAGLLIRLTAGAGVLFLGLAILFYLILRFTEFKALAKMLSLKQFLLSLLFTLLGLPVQRIFLNRNFKTETEA